MKSNASSSEDSALRELYSRPPIATDEEGAPPMHTDAEQEARRSDAVANEKAPTLAADTDDEAPPPIEVDV